MATGPALVFGELVFPLNKVTNSVGRKDRITNMVPDVDLGTLDTERSVSRRHAEIAYDHGVVTLRDLGSTNGTTVSGGRLALQVDRTLQDGETVGFGAVTLTYQAAAQWPEGVEAEWPPEPEPALEETMVVSPEETMVAPPTDFASSETAIFTPGEMPAAVPETPAPLPEEAPAELPEPAAAEAPQPEPEPAAWAEAEPVAPPEAEPPAAAVAEPEPAIAAAPEPEPVAAPAEAAQYVACSNHPHLPAVGLCPGCLEAFCVDCLPEREDGLMVCNRCAGISYRLAAAVAGMPGAAAGGGVPVAAGPADAPAGEEAPKQWPF